MKAIKTFGEQLVELMGLHSLNATSLASALGMNGAIGVARLTHNQASDKKQRELIALLRELGEPFSEQEIALLEKCIDVNRLGKRAYKTQRSIEELIFGNQTAAPVPMMENSHETLTEYLQKIPQREPLQILCVNCIESGVLAALEPLITDPKRLIEVNHYVSINEDTRNPALLINAASRLLNNPRYHLYTTSNADNGTDAYFFTPCLLLLKIGTWQDVSETLLIVSSDHTVRYATAKRTSNLYDICAKWLREVRPEPKLLRTVFGTDENVSLNDQVFTTYQLEKKRTFYQIKPDLCSGSFPPEVLVSVVSDNPDVTEEAKRDMEIRLMPLINARYRNLIEKTQPTYLCCSVAAVKAFFRTGVLIDQMPIMRPCNVEERLIIINDLIGRINTNPRYHFAFLFEDMEIRGYQCIGYEGLGVFVVKCDTHYETDKVGENLMISEPMFLAQYINYYTETLLPRHTYSEKESLRMLEAIKAELENVR